MARLGRGYPVQPQAVQPGQYIPVAPAIPPATAAASSIGVTAVYVTARRSGGRTYTSVVCIGATNVTVRATGRHEASVLSSGLTQVTIGRVSVAQLVSVGPVNSRTVVTLLYTPDNGSGSGGNIGNNPILGNNQPITASMELTGHYVSGSV